MLCFNRLKRKMILRWSPFKIVSVSAVLYPRWPPWLKIEFFSNGQNCSILSQKVSKFELYKHNDELFNIFYGIFYELKFCRFWPIISAKFGWDWLSSFRGEDFFLISSPLFSNLHNRLKSSKFQFIKSPVIYVKLFLAM
jgi:thermostable 8-oxoguanine DNA glycosylase